MTHTQKEFIHSYIDTMVWADTPEDEQNYFNAAPISLDALKVIVRDCKEFMEASKLFSIEQTTRRCAHDFWLTRQGHGAGFWDGDYPVYGDKLTALCHWRGEFQEQDLYLGDDNRIYLS